MFMCKRADCLHLFGFLLIVNLLSLCLLSTVALANNERTLNAGGLAGVDDVATTFVESSDAIAQGSWGTCPWEISRDGVLTVYGGEGANPSTPSSLKSPWEAYSDYIRSIVFSESDGPVIARGDACEALFRWLENVETIDLTGLDTSEATDMAYMFSECRSLKSIDLTCLNTSQVTRMLGMFDDCMSLTSINLRGLDTSSLESIQDMFKHCTSLKDFSLTGFDTSCVTNMSGLFYGCQSLETLDLTGFDTSNVTSMGPMFFGCSQLKSLDLSGLNTSNVTGMGYMFYGCRSLEFVDFTGVNTSSVTAMSYMFDGCSSLDGLNLSSFSTSKVATFENMFNGCASLSALDLSSFGFLKATSTRNMFNGCLRLGTLLLPDLDMPMVLDLSSMFASCKSLTTIDLKGFRAPFVKNMSNLFSGCSSLEDLDLSGFDTSSVTDLSGLFSGCAALTELDLSNFDTSKVVSMSGMFAGCTALEELNLSSFDMSNVQNPIDMVPWKWATDAGCTSLSKISLGQKATKITLPTYEVNYHTDWLSQNEGKWYTSAEIASSRKGIADVYTKGDPITRIEDAKVAISGDVVYDGQPQEPQPEVRVDSNLLDPETDYTLEFSNNVNAGTACVVITGKGNYIGTVEASFTILPASIKEASITGLATKVYTGAAQMQSPVVAMGTKTLEAGIDYSISYANNKNAGTATITVAGKGNYTGSASATFKIKPASIAKVSIASIANKVYTGAALKPLPAVKLAGKTLKSGVDYKVSYKNNVKVGTASVIITGIGNYSGTVTKYFKICWPLSKASVAKISPKVYTGKAINPALKVVYRGKTLKKGVDYTVAYTANVKAGTAKVTIKGKGSYIGTKTVAFEIRKASLAKAKIGSIPNQKYTGNAIKPSPKVILNGRQLKAGVDYILVYSNNRSAGIARVTVKGKGNYTGARTVSFKIVKR